MMEMIALSNRNDDSALSRRFARVTLVLVGLAALAGVAVAVSGSVLADGGSGDSPVVTTQEQVSPAAAEINVTRRNISSTTARPGETVTVEVFVDTDGSLGSTELVEVTDQFSSAFANIELNESDPDPSGAAPGPNNEEFLSIWNVDRANYTVSYDVTIPTTAEDGDTFDITGTVSVGDEQQSLPSETITVTTDIPEETGVKLEPVDASSTPNGQQTFDVVVTGAGSGVGSYSINISSSNVTVGEITNIQHTNQPATDDSQIASDGSWGLVKADLGSNDHPADFSITVAKVTVDTGAVGVSDFTIDSSAQVANATGDQYGLDSIDGAMLTVEKGATFELSNLSPEITSVEAGQTFDVSADVTNTGGVSGQQDLELRLEPNGPAQVTKTVQLNAGETRTITFEDVSVSTTGTYNHTIASNADRVVGNLTVTEATGANLQVTNAVDDNTDFTANNGSTGVAGVDTIEISATVENTASSSSTETLEYKLGGSTQATKSVQFNATETKTVTFTVTLPVESAGTYDHGIYAGGSNATTSIELLPQVNVGSSPARDTTGDGLMEDVNGDKNFNIFDVQTLFEGLGSSPIDGNAQYFDFDPDDPPVVDIFDIQALFEML